MKTSIKKLMSLGIWITIILFVLRCVPSMATILELWNENNFGELAYTFLGYIGEAIAVGFFLVKIFDLWIWKWKIIRRFHDVPVLAQRYNGKIFSSYNKENSYEGQLTVKQSFTNISIKYKSSESTSISIIAEIINNFDTIQLIYTYQNDPNANILNRSPIHRGTAIFDIDNVEKIEGDYFTDRGSVGHMVFTIQKNEENSNN